MIPARGFLKLESVSNTSKSQSVTSYIMSGSQFFRVPFRVVFLLRSQHLCPLLSRFHRSLAAEGVKELLRPLIPFLGVSLTHTLSLSLSLSLVSRVWRLGLLSVQYCI